MLSRGVPAAMSICPNSATCKVDARQPLAQLAGGRVTNCGRAVLGSSASVSSSFAAAAAAEAETADQTARH